MEDTYEQFLTLIEDFKEFLKEFGKFVNKNLHLSFIKFENGKSIFAQSLYRQRGKMARRFIHTGMAGLTAVGMMIAPIVAEEFPGNAVDPWNIGSNEAVLSAEAEEPTTQTLVSEKMRDKVIEYKVQEGDTVSSIAKKFDVSEDTIRWQNGLKTKSAIKIGQILEIPPITGVAHKVQKGDTVYSIAKKYSAEAQGIVDFPYNTFTNDETFELAIGQVVIVPDGVKPEETYWSPVASIRQITPNAGTVVASGSFVWPTSGSITQRFAWYHKGIDIANNSAPEVLAADAGTVIVPPYMPGGYGNYVLINHGNGYVTLYGHMQKIYVVPNQTVKRNDAIGKMGSTGRSTGTHLHFEIRQSGSAMNPLSILK
jgi:murein DD-endopeptidase MepM/ murein hydrolase activator NlpD